MSNVISMPLYRARHRAYPFKNPLVVYSHGDFHDWLFYNVKGYKELKMRAGGIERKFSREIERIENILRERCNFDYDENSPITKVDFDKPHSANYYNGLLDEAETLKAEWERMMREVCDDIRDLSIDFLKKNGYDGVVLEMYLYPPLCDEKKFAERAFIYI